MVCVFVCVWLLCCVRVCVCVCVFACDVLPEVVKPNVKHWNMLWKRKCMFKRREIGSSENQSTAPILCCEAERQRESEAERDKEGRRERADYILVTPCFVPFTFGIIREYY